MILAFALLFGFIGYICGSLWPIRTLIVEVVLLTLIIFWNPIYNLCYPPVYNPFLFRHEIITADQFNLQAAQIVKWIDKNALE